MYFNTGKILLIEFEKTAASYKLYDIEFIIHTIRDPTFSLIIPLKKSINKSLYFLFRRRVIQHNFTTKKSPR